MEKKTHCARYTNTNGVAVAIVASVNYFKGELFDWAAYIGGTTEVWHEEDAIRDALDYGSKLHAKDAQHYFPDLPIGRYRH